MTHRPVQVRLERTALDAAVMALALASVGWGQPAAQPPKDDEVPKGHVVIDGDVAVTTKDGTVVVQTKDGTGRVLTQKLQLPAQAAIAGARHMLGAHDRGSLALNEKHVFVLLNGVLYQYDIETLELKAHVKVQPPGQKTVETVTFPAGAWGAVFGETAPVVARKPKLGINIAPVTQELADELGLEKAAGAHVTCVVPGTVAEKIGMKAGDIILKYNKLEVDTVQDLMEQVQDTKAGAEVEIVVMRDGKEQTLEAKIK